MPEEESWSNLKNGRDMGSTKMCFMSWKGSASKKHFIWLVKPIITLNTIYLIRVANHNSGYTLSNSWSQSEHRICFIQHVWLTVLFSFSWRGENYGRLLFMGISFTTAPDICPPGWMHWNDTCYYFALFWIKPGRMARRSTGMSENPWRRPCQHSQCCRERLYRTPYLRVSAV